MRLFLPPLVIEPNEGFSSSKDIFERAKIGTGLTNVVSVVSDPIVIAVDGQWGSGKTTFLQMWAGELRRSGFPVVWFDAFQHDYSDDAFAAFASEILALAHEHEASRSKTTKTFRKVAKETGKIILRTSLGVGLKVATAGLVDAASLASLGTDISEEISKAADKALDDLIESRAKEKDQIEAFREALSAMPTQLSNEKTEGGVKPLVFIIDELDRCRPPFALQVLERIKHFFSVPNVHFVLGVHVEQLANSVRVMYGPEINAPLYLQKFIHLSINLSGVTEHRTDSVEARYVRHLKKAFEFDPGDRETVDTSVQVIEYLARRRGLGLRDLERIFTYLALAIAYTPKNYFRPQMILGSLCVLKVVSAGLFEKAKRGAITYEELAAELLPGVAKEEDGTDTRLRDWWMLCTGLEPKDQDWAQSVKRQLSFNYNTELTEAIPYVANDMIDRLIPR